MNGIERIMSLVSGKLPDRVPVICNMLEQGARELGMDIKTYYSKGEFVARGQLALRERFGYDNLWGFFYTAKEAELLGSRGTIFAADGPPNVGDLIIKEPFDIDRLRIPESVIDHAGFREEAECIRILKKEAGGRYPVLAAAVGSFSKPAILMGVEKWLDLMLNGPEDRMNRLLEKCSEYYQKQVEAFRKAGADLIVYINPFASPDVIPKKIFNRHALEWICRDMERTSPEGVVYFNGGGRINPTIDDIIKHAKIGVYYINPMDDPAEAKRIIAGRGISTGVINDIRLIGDPPEAIDAEVRRIMSAGKEGGGFIFGTLVMPYRIPEENIMTMLEAAYRYGAYKAAPGTGGAHGV